MPSTEKMYITMARIELTFTSEGSESIIVVTSHRMRRACFKSRTARSACSARGRRNSMGGSLTTWSEMR